MKRVPALLLTLAVMLGMTTPVFADLITPTAGELAVLAAKEVLPTILIIVVLVITALLVRHFTKKK